MSKEERLREKLRKRWNRLNDKFVWTPESIQKIKDLNNGLYALYRKAYDDLKALKNDIDARLAVGVSVYKGYIITAELDFWVPDRIAKDEETLWTDLCNESDFCGPILIGEQGKKMVSFEEQMLIDKLSWKEYPFDTPLLDDIYIYFFMHDLFNHNKTFSLEDAVKMKPEDFSYQIKIELEPRQVGIKKA